MTLTLIRPITPVSLWHFSDSDGLQSNEKQGGESLAAAAEAAAAREEATAARAAAESALQEKVKHVEEPGSGVGEGGI